MCSAAKDGTCKVWDVTHTGKINLPAASEAKNSSSNDNISDNSGNNNNNSSSSSSSAGSVGTADVGREAISDVPCCVDGIAGTGSAAAGGKGLMQCRGCR